MSIYTQQAKEAEERKHFWTDLGEFTESFKMEEQVVVGNVCIERMTEVHENEGCLIDVCSKRHGG